MPSIFATISKSSPVFPVCPEPLPLGESFLAGFQYYSQGNYAGPTRKQWWDTSVTDVRQCARSRMAILNCKVFTGFRVHRGRRKTDDNCSAPLHFPTAAARGDSVLGIEISAKRPSTLLQEEQLCHHPPSARPPPLHSYSILIPVFSRSGTYPPAATLTRASGQLSPPIGGQRNALLSLLRPSTLCAPSTLQSPASFIACELFIVLF